VKGDTRKVRVYQCLDRCDFTNKWVEADSRRRQGVPAPLCWLLAALQWAASYPLSTGKLSSDGMASGRHSHGSRSHSPPPQFPILQPSPGCIASIRSSHLQIRPVLGHTGGDQAGATTSFLKSSLVRFFTSKRGNWQPQPV
jgi:hypothetical protein